MIRMESLESRNAALEAASGASSPVLQTRAAAGIEEKL
jgi:hypothetical protein